MAEGLGLQSALRSYTQGLAWKQGQEQLAKQQAQQRSMEEANAAATGVIEQSRGEWAANGAQGEYRPNNQTLFKAAEARGQALAKAGLWDQFLQNEASVAPIRLKTRAEALQRYQIDGDVDKLAREVYPTLFDGKTIVGSEKIEGAPAGAGFPVRPEKLLLKLSDGSSHSVEPQQLVAQIKLSLDPEALKRESLLNFENAKAKLQAEAKIEVEREKGRQDRDTNREKAKASIGLEQAKFGYQQQIHGADNASRERVAAGNNAATRDAAQRAAEARRYAADVGLTAARERKDGAGEGGAGGLNAAQKWADLAKSHLGKFKDGGFGGSRIAGQMTLDVATAAQRIYAANKGKLTELQAIDRAAKLLGVEATDE